MQIDPIPPGEVTMETLGAGFNQIHQCVEDMKENHGAALTALQEDIAKVKETLMVDKPKSPAGLQSVQATVVRNFFTVSAAGSSLFVLYKFLYYMYHPFLLFLHAIFVAILRS